MNKELQEISQRISSLRDDMNIPVKEMAELHGITEEEYRRQESGVEDFTFTFLYNTANRLGIDMTDLLTGRTPTLSEFSIVRKNEGLAIKRRAGFSYSSLAFQFKNRMAEPFLVKAPGVPPGTSIPLRNHHGQEFNYILSGTLRIQIGSHETILREGDSIYYNASSMHGMQAEEQDCVFIAVVIRDEGGKIG